MKARVTIAILAFAFLLDCEAKEVAKSLSTPPAKLVAAIEGFLGASYRVELAVDGSITYLYNPQTFTSSEGTQRINIKIPPERWALFRKKLDTAKVWSWRSDYINRTVTDGTVWRLEVTYGDRSVNSHGVNAFPSKKQFEKFRAAVQDLTGKKFE